MNSIKTHYVPIAKHIYAMQIHQGESGLPKNAKSFTMNRILATNTERTV
jgi:hypothetical protein